MPKTGDPFEESGARTEDLLSVAAMSGLIGSIYDCALDPGQWERTLAGIAHALGGDRAILSLNDLQQDCALIAKSAGWEPHWLAERAKHLPEIHGLMGWWLAQQTADEPFVALRDVPSEHLVTSPYVREVLQPLGIADIAHFMLISTATRFSELVIFRRHVFTEREIAMGRLLLPHLRRAVTISNVLDVRTIERTWMAEALDTLRHGVLLTDERGTVLHANRSAERMLRDGDPIEVTSGTLRTRSTPANNELRRAITLAARDEARIGKAGTAIRLNGTDLPPVFAHVLPMGGSDLRAGLQPRSVAAVFVGPTLDREDGAEMLAAAFGLTRAETRIVKSLLAGHSLAQTAAELGIAMTTTKTHLRSIFAKTGVSRQAELVRLAMQAAPPT
jgi:DNA-binding CsgD family transcriptional regulator